MVGVIPSIPGLRVFPEWCSTLAERRILSVIGDAGAPIGGTQRNRIARYGAGVVASGYVDGVPVPTTIEPLIPVELDVLGLQLQRQGIMPTPDAVTVNWFLPGQGVDPHIDRPEAGAVIAVLSLQGSARLRMQRYEHPARYSFPVGPRTLVVMRDEARWIWHHEIEPVDMPRVSIVFRRALP